jgi:hypothetical protein
VVAAAALLVLAGLVMFVLGITTAVAAWSWACLAACGAAGVLLVVARRRTPPDPAPAGGTRSGGATAAAPADRPGPPSGGRTPPAAPATPAAREAAPGTHDAPVADDGLRAEARPSALRPGAAATATGGSPQPVAGEPGEEDGEVTDLLLVVDLADEVLVVDEHPRYHLAGCSWLAGRETIPLPLREARGDGFTPCAACTPDAHVATVERARRAARRG